jgi:hypothetical protein
MRQALDVLEHVQIIFKLSDNLSKNRNVIQQGNEGLSSILKGQARKGQEAKTVKPIEIDELFIGKLLRHYKDCFTSGDDQEGTQKCDAGVLKCLYLQISISNKPLHAYIKSYFRTLLLKMYRFNKTQTTDEAKFSQSLPLLIHFFEKEQDMQMNRQF